MGVRAQNAGRAEGQSQSGNLKNCWRSMWPYPSYLYFPQRGFVLRVPRFLAHSAQSAPWSYNSDFPDGQGRIGQEFVMSSLPPPPRPAQDAFTCKE